MLNKVRNYLYSLSPKQLAILFITAAVLDVMLMIAIFQVFGF